MPRLRRKTKRRTGAGVLTDEERLGFVLLGQPLGRFQNYHEMWAYYCDNKTDFDSRWPDEDRFHVHAMFNIEQGFRSELKRGPLPYHGPIRSRAKPAHIKTHSPFWNCFYHKEED